MLNDLTFLPTNNDFIFYSFYYLFYFILFCYSVVASIGYRCYNVVLVSVEPWPQVRYDEYEQGR